LTQGFRIRARFQEKCFGAVDRFNRQGEIVSIALVSERLKALDNPCPYLSQGEQVPGRSIVVY
jgi:hypothetical protein